VSHGPIVAPGSDTSSEARSLHRKSCLKRADNRGVTTTFDRTAALLEALRNADGGFGMRAGQPSEPEPTALAALALDDEGARGWLASAQAADGSFGMNVGPYRNDSATGLAALALVPGPERERALDHVERTRAERVEPSEAVPLDAEAIGWAWAEGTASWTEPTARALLALRSLRPGSDATPDGIALLRDREAVGGGWNYGNRTVLDEDLPPYVQTTAIALLALLGADAPLESRGLDVLAGLWRTESSGGLSVATTLAAFRVHGEDQEAAAAADVLEDLVAETGLVGDAVALAWAAIATSDGLGRLAPT
jgi:hypothetical protein